MKKLLVASILGLSTSVIPAYGQAAILFDNYNSNPVQWTMVNSEAPSGRAGSLVAAMDNFKVDLEWESGSTSFDTGLAISVGDGGVFHGPLVPLSGPLEPGSITFTVLAWNGASYASSTATGSVTWSQLNPGTFPLPLDMPALIVQLVPEPSVITLAGLGIASVVFAGRRTRRALNATFL